MRMTRLNETDEAAKVGLKPIAINRLGQVVALFGPNGAGKSRLLSVARSTIAKLQNIAVKRKEIDDQILALRNQRIPQLQGIINRQPPPPNLGHYQKALEQATIELPRLECTRDEFDQSFAYFPQPRQVVLSFDVRPELGHGNLSLDSVRGASDMLRKRETPVEFGDGALSLASALSYAAYEATNPQADRELLNPLLPLYSEARKIIRELMKMEFGFVPQGVGALPALDGRHIKPQELSQGQRILFRYAMYAVQQLAAIGDTQSRKTIKGSIIFLDEPETHLHPAALLRFLADLRALVGEEGQIWLATHSVALLSALRPHEVFIMHQGEVKASGTDANDAALRALIGSEENVEALRRILYEPVRWASSRFVSECLLAPGRVGYKENDPQLGIVGEVLARKLTGNEEVNILDVGAGEGRLVAMLQTSLPRAERPMVKYAATEIDISQHDAIRAAVGDLAHPLGVVPDHTSIATIYDGTFAVAVLCNVLHEIRPTTWMRQMNALLRLLSKDGAILILEDQEMPVGEMPNDLGFIIMNATELQTLFGLKKPPVCHECPDERYKTRLLCVEIPKVEGITIENVKQAVESVKRRAEAKVREFRLQATGGCRNGGAYGFYSQLFVNATFAVSELGG